ncbi:S8 family serine peptidase [Algibacter lectus]|uniref:S8 family serine peptidase n=1 Tax=Algibacter lectus TaxID=221126 RepID=UPI002493FD6A|nr:S8 family serine peptidase [Algibacter lectus]
MKKIILSLSLFAFSCHLFSQEDAWVYLADKENETTFIANPLTMLTQKALDRKARHGVSIDARDVPVNEDYVTAIKNADGISVLAKSKWFNAVHVRGEKTAIENLFINQNNLIEPQRTFISKIVFADRSQGALEKSTNEKRRYKFETILTDYNYGNANQNNQIKMINGDVLHQTGFTGEGMTVAIMDGGFPNVNTMSSFEALRNNGRLLNDYDFVNRDDDVYTNTSTNHGTLVLSAMAGYIDTATKNYVGTAPNASYYLFITEDNNDENPVEESYWVEAAERADSLGVDIINTSLGYDDFDPGTKYDYEPSDMDGQTAYITKGANIAFEKGMLLVTSAGNAWGASVGAPADSPNVLTIGAVDSNGDYAMFSSIGTTYQPTIKPDVVAQGASSYLINEFDNIITNSGTSFSAPILAGGIACLWQAYPSLTNSEIMDLVRESASQYNNPDFYLGYGIPDLEKALANIYALDTTSASMNDKITLYPNPMNARLFVSLPTDDFATLNLFDVSGKKINTYQVSNENNWINTSELAKGLYVVRLETVNGIDTFRLIKE